MCPPCAVHSYDEWSQLREVIVGHARAFAGFQLDNSFDLFYWDNIRPFLASREFFKTFADRYEWPVIRIEPWILAELEEDIAAFVETLLATGIAVRRPADTSSNAQLRTPFWESTQSPPLNVRDQTLILGSTIIETAPHVRSRIFENDYLKPLFYEYLRSGAHWVCMPRPSLTAGVLDSSFFELRPEEELALRDHHALSMDGLKREIVFDAAQCVRLGRDVLVNVANESHELGYRWLVAVLGDRFRFHRLSGVADTHIDSILLPLRPGLWLIRDRRYLDYLPPALRRWDTIVAPESKKDLYPSYHECALSIASRFIDMNVLSLSEGIVVVNSLYPELITVLEKYGFAVAPVRNRHRRLFGGGFHCFTLDVRRDGGPEQYVD